MKVFDVACFLVHAVHAAVWSRTTFQRLYGQLLAVIVEDHYPWSVVFCFLQVIVLLSPLFQQDIPYLILQNQIFLVGNGDISLG